MSSEFPVSVFLWFYRMVFKSALSQAWWRYRCVLALLISACYFLYGMCLYNGLECRKDRRCGIGFNAVMLLGSVALLRDYKRLEIAAE